MSIDFQDLLTRLQDDVPERNGVPGAEQYERAILEAVADFGKRAPREKKVTLNVTAQVDTYDLPEDFLDIVRLAGIIAPGGIINTPEGLIPLMGWYDPNYILGNKFINAPEDLIPTMDYYKERYVIVKNKITFTPVPTYTLARDLYYQAGWALTLPEGNDYDYLSNEVYEEMTEVEAGIILIKAGAICLQKQANKEAPSGWKYQFGDEVVDKSNQGASFDKRIDGLTKQYLDAVAAYIGPAFRRG